MDKELEKILYPSLEKSPVYVLDPSNAKNEATHLAPSREPTRNSSVLQKRIVIGACVVSTAVIGGLLIPFVSPGFRRIALPYVPATDRQVRLVSSVLAKRTGNRMVDLGSGDGRLVLAAAKEGLHATGVEMNWWLVLWSRWRSYILGLSKQTKFIRQDLYKCDLGKYDIVVLFGVSDMMEPIRKKLLKEMKPDGLFVACRFPLPSVKPMEQLGAGIDSVWVYRKSDVGGLS